TNDIDLSTLEEGTVTQQPSTKEKTPKIEEKTEDAPSPSGETSTAPSSLHAALGSMTAFVLSLPGWYRSRSVLKKILIPALPLVLLIVVTGALFSKSTHQQLQNQARQPEPPPSTAIATKSVEKPVQPVAAIPAPKPAKKETIASEKKFRKKWTLPSFFIVAGESNNPSLFISIDLTLVLQLGPDKQLPEERLSYLRDSIFQFYRNRPAYELKHFALARGEMIRQLNNWLKKEWPESPISTIMFNKYQVIS
ncbi:MAG: flagellar basal body-associated FliL family protein, partial [Desulfobulbaceae bacterium]|nr:flagellar basal body-associated FliL family protein [Desulfobulbaceae bacterium]